MSRIRILTAALALAAAPTALAGETCPNDALKVTGTADAPFACTCAPNVSTSGWVYGTDRYTADSSICTSAVHAGVIQAAPGGDVKIYTGEGCGSFVSTTKNGITSASWGSYGATFAFVTPPPASAAAASSPASRRRGQHAGLAAGAGESESNWLLAPVGRAPAATDSGASGGVGAAIRRRSPRSCAGGFPWTSGRRRCPAAWAPPG